MAFLRKQSSTSVPTIIIGGPDANGFTGTVIVNSGVVAIGDVLGVVSGAGVANSVVVRRYNSAGDAILGVCVGVRQASGAVVAADAGTIGTYTVGAANETTGGKLYAEVDITPGAVWSASSSATLHTTAVFGFGAWADPDTAANAGRILESGVTRTTVQGRGLACLGPDPEDTTRGLVTIEETVFKAGLGA